MIPAAINPCSDIYNTHTNSSEISSFLFLPARLHQRITALHKKYGPIFRVQMGPINSVFISSPDLMRSVFMYEGKYPKHPLPETWVYYNQKYNCKRGLFFM